MAAMIPLHDDNPISIQPVVTVALIVACVVAFLWQVSLGDEGFQRAVYGLGLIPAVLFRHRGAVRRAGNGAGDAHHRQFDVPARRLDAPDRQHALSVIFGNNIEDAMGHGRFIVFYLLCGVAAALAQALSAPATQIPMIGASGAVSGVLGAYLLLFPHARVQMVVPIGFVLHTFRLPAMVVLGLWIGFQLLNSAMSSGGEVARPGSRISAASSPAWH